MERITDEKIFYKKMIFIGVPVVFQNLISIGLNLIDTLMIGMLGEQELAAVGAANQVYFIFTVSLFGLYSGAAVYTAQYWGAQDIDGVRKLLGIDYIVGFVFALVVSVAAYVFAPQIIGLFSEDPEVIGFGEDYIKIACFSYVFSGFSGAISYNSRAIQNLTVPTIINATALGVNAVLNYLLIFGKAGLPQMGVEGAATATLIARIFELAALLTYIYTRKEHPFKASPAKIFGFGRELFGKVIMTLLMIALSKPVASIYNFSGETNHLLIITLITMAITITPKMIGYIYVVGILRAGGDTLFCMKLEILCNMFIMVPLAYIAVLVFHLSLPLTMLLIEVGDLVRTFVCMPRFKSRKWINIVTDIEEQN